jgi:recombination protein RecA
VEKSGAWFSYGEMRLGQGRENVRDLLRSKPDLTAEIANKVRQSVIGEPVAGPDRTLEAEPEGVSVLS